MIIKEEYIPKADVLNLIRHNWDIHCGNVAMQESIIAITNMPSITLTREENDND